MKRKNPITCKHFLPLISLLLQATHSFENSCRKSPLAFKLHNLSTVKKPAFQSRHLDFRLRLRTLRPCTDLVISRVFKILFIFTISSEITFVSRMQFLSFASPLPVVLYWCNQSSTWVRERGIRDYAKRQIQSQRLNFSATLWLVAYLGNCITCLQ